MTIDLNVAKCQTYSNQKLFGLCDEPSPIEKPAFIDEKNGAKWIAVVVNEHKFEVTFTAIDHCIEILRKDGNKDKRCDGVLTYGTNIIFVELKQISGLGNDWVKVAEKQLRTTIAHFKNSEEAQIYTSKKAYIANSEHPKSKESQARRMEQFFIDTHGYVLRIENRIVLE